MHSTSIPRALSFLLDEPNAAADDALLEILPHGEPATRDAALNLLLQRNRPAALASLVGKFQGYEEELRNLVLRHDQDLFAAARLAANAPDQEDQAGAIEFVVRSRRAELFYLLADLLTSEHSRSRDMAAAGLLTLIEELEQSRAGTSSEGEQTLLHAREERLMEVLVKALDRWEIHFQPRVIQAVMRMGDRGDDALREKLSDPRTKISLVINGLLCATTDPCLAAFALRSLAIPELRAAAVQPIQKPPTKEFRAAIAECAWMLADPRIEHGCRWVHSGPWTPENAHEVMDYLPSSAQSAVKLVCSTGASPDRKMELLRGWLTAGHEELRAAVVWQLIADPGDDATALLISAAARSDALAKIAAREIRRRKPGSTEANHSSSRIEHLPDRGADDEDFEVQWERFDPSTPVGRERFQRTARAAKQQWLVRLRERMTGQNPLDRLRAVSFLTAAGWLESAAEHLYPLAFDRDPMVRARAIAAIAELPGATALRILRVAASDADPRVQANAIEALERISAPDRERQTAAKLTSRDNRVRANAVKSLLQIEFGRAGEVLLEMLADTFTAHRISALWVIERLRLHSVIERVASMSTDDPEERVRNRAMRVLNELQGIRRTSTEFDEKRNRSAGETGRRSDGR